MFWVPGHEGIDLNERADINAKEAASRDTEDILLDVSLSALKRTTRSLCKPNPEIFDTRKPLLFRTPPKKIWKALANLEKGRAFFNYVQATLHSILTCTNMFQILSPLQIVFSVKSQKLLTIF